MAFHYKDNWYFDRLSDGSVQIYRGTHDISGFPLYPSTSLILEIDADSWCSIIASVSKDGENARTWELAKQLHNREAETFSFA